RGRVIFIDLQRIGAGPDSRWVFDVIYERTIFELAYSRVAIVHN
ncbi:hypothetical protein PSYPI_45990, partial [Pseudomonas syringae pv. pisi str. 1704B]